MLLLLAPAELHPRTLIRFAIVAALLGATAAAARVFATRVVPVRRTELPAIAVYTIEEDAEDKGTAPRELERVVQVAIEAVVHPAALSPADDVLDALSLQIEKAMHADPYLGGNAGDCLLTKTEIGVLPDGERLLGQLLLTYAVTYHTLAPAGEATDEFLRVHAEHNLGNQVHELDQAVDDFDVRPEAP